MPINELNTTVADPLHKFPALGLSDRIRISNTVPAEVARAVEQFHRQTSLLRRSRFGLDITPYQDDEVYHATAKRQARFSEKRIGTLGYHAPMPKASLRRMSSKRSFSFVAAIPYEILSKFLFHAFCEGLAVETSAPYASAGATYAVHVFLLPLANVVGAPFGADNILHLAAYEQSLYLMSETGATMSATTCLDCIPGSEPNSYENATFLLAYVLDLEVAALRYAERGYRFGLIEAGLMAQQATLVSQHLGFGSCIFGGFPDAEFSAALGLNPKKMLACLAHVFGKI